MFQKTDLQKKNYFIKSLAHGLRVLSAFTPQQPALTISEITKRTGLLYGTVFRLVYTLEYLGYLVRDEENKKYRQSVRMLTLSLPARESLIVRNVALPFLKELSRRTNESAKLAVLDGVEIVFIAVIEVREKLSHSTPIGYRSPAYCTALGKALLGFQPLEEWDGLISMIEFTPRTDKTICDPEQFKAELQRIRAQGYACQDQEYIPGLFAIAAPIFDHDGELVAAINLASLSSELVGDMEKEDLIKEVLDHAQQISVALGFQTQGTLLQQ